MHLPDVNVWLALFFPAHAHHHTARTWFDSTSGICHFCRFTQIAFLRLANNPSAFPQAALTQDQAWVLYDEITAHPRVSFIADPPELESHWRHYTQLQRFAPKTWNDAYLAAFARAAGLTVVSFDRGLAAYRDVNCVVLS